MSVLKKIIDVDGDGIWCDVIGASYINGSLLASGLVQIEKVDKL